MRKQLHFIRSAFDVALAHNVARVMRIPLAAAPVRMGLGIIVRQLLRFKADARRVGALGPEFADMLHSARPTSSSAGSHRLAHGNASWQGIAPIKDDFL